MFEFGKGVNPEMASDLTTPVAYTGPEDDDVAEPGVPFGFSLTTSRDGTDEALAMCDWLDPEVRHEFEGVFGYEIDDGVSFGDFSGFEADDDTE
jgi:hypothetical protein